MSKREEEFKRELLAKSLDTIRVKNPTEQDYEFWFNRAGTGGIPPQKHTVPNKNKDVGYGKGQIDLPRYLANLYRNQMIVKLVNDEHAVEWEKMKKKYKPEEYERIEQRYAPKTNDPTMIKKYLPSVVVGLVEKYEFPIEEDMTDKLQRVSGDDKFDMIANELGLTDKVIQTRKEDFENAVSN